MELNHKVNPSFNANRQKLSEVLPIDTPFSIILDTSDLCNLRCQYCFRAEAATSRNGRRAWGSNKLMPWDTFLRILDQIGEFPDAVKKISLSGHGEPLANKLVPDMVREIKKRYKSNVEIHTNATLLNKEYALDLVDSEIDKIIISLQGLNAEKYREICNRNIDFEVFYQNLLTLFKNKKKTEIYIKVADVALEENEDSIFYMVFSPIADKVFIEKTVPLWEDVNYSQDLSINTININKYGKEVPYVKCCSLMFYALLITPIGMIYPCTQAMMSYDIGNVYDSTLLQCWNGNKRRKLLFAHLEKGREIVPDCKKCYVAQNSILADEDIIDEYRFELLSRLNNL